MVEKVARAIFGEESLDELGADVQKRMRSKAIAAIKAMREPNEAMVEGMRQNIGPLLAMWRGGVDAALGEHK